MSNERQKPRWWVRDSDGTVRTVDTMIEWGRWFEDPDNRRVAVTALGERGNVSTVFLGMDHGWGRSESPVLWETMVFGGGPHDGYQERYRSEEDAKRGHERIVACLRDGLDPGEGQRS